MSSIFGLCVNGAFLITLIPSVLLLLFMILILVFSVMKLHDNDKIQAAIKILYYISCTCGIITITLIIIYVSLVCFPSTFDAIYSGLEVVAGFVYGALLTNIHCILLSRVYLTFKKSAFKVSKYQMIICGSLLATYLVCGCCFIGFVVAEEEIYGKYRIFVTVTVALTLIAYFSLSIYGIFLFAQKMYRLSQMVRTNHAEGTVNDKQLKLLATTAKYISLLSFSIFTTWISFAFYLIIIATNRLSGNWGLFGFQIFCFQIGIDCCINIVCLYLQFPFTQRHYDKFCAWFGNFWLYILKAKVGKNLETKDQQCIEMDNNVSTRAKNAIDYTNKA